MIVKDSGVESLAESSLELARFEHEGPGGLGWDCQPRVACMTFRFHVVQWNLVRPYNRLDRLGKSASGGRASSFKSCFFPPGNHDSKQNTRVRDSREVHIHSGDDCREYGYPGYSST